MASQLGHLNHWNHRHWPRTSFNHVMLPLRSSTIVDFQARQRVTQSWTWLYIRFYWCRTHQCLFVNERKYPLATNHSVHQAMIPSSAPIVSLQESSHIIRWPVEHDTFSIKPECYFVSNWIHWCLHSFGSRRCRLHPICSGTRIRPVTKMQCFIACCRIYGRNVETDLGHFWRPVHLTTSIFRIAFGNSVLTISSCNGIVGKWQLSRDSSGI